MLLSSLLSTTFQEQERRSGLDAALSELIYARDTFLRREGGGREAGAEEKLEKWKEGEREGGRGRVGLTSFHGSKWTLTMSFPPPPLQLL